MLGISTQLFGPSPKDVVVDVGITSRFGNRYASCAEQIYRLKLTLSVTSVGSVFPACQVPPAGVWHLPYKAWQAALAHSLSPELQEL